MYFICAIPNARTAFMLEEVCEHGFICKAHGAMGLNSAVQNF